MPAVFNLSISLLLWKDKINTECKKGLGQCQAYYTPWPAPHRCWGPRLQPTKSIGKSGTASITLVCGDVCIRMLFMKISYLASPQCVVLVCK